MKKDNQSIDDILTELKTQYQFSNSYKSQLIPIIRKIFDAKTPTKSRSHLIKVMRESCQRMEQMDKVLSEIERDLKKHIGLALLKKTEPKSNTVFH